MYVCVWGGSAGAYKFLNYRITVDVFENYRNTVIHFFYRYRHRSIFYQRLYFTVTVRWLWSCNGLCEWWIDTYFYRAEFFFESPLPDLHKKQNGNSKFAMYLIGFSDNMWNLMEIGNGGSDSKKWIFAFKKPDRAAILRDAVVDCEKFSFWQACKPSSHWIICLLSVGEYFFLSTWSHRLISSQVLSEMT